MKWLAFSLSFASLFGAEFMIRPIDPPAALESGMPFLATSSNGTIYLSWIDMLGGKDHALRFSRWTGKAWAAPETIATGNHWFVNWADFPALAVLDDGSMLAHWLQRAPGDGKYGYGIQVARRSPRENKWTKIHGMSLDETSDYAGFLTFVPGEGKAVFLSPPSSAQHAGHDEHRKTMRFISFQTGGAVESDIEVDADTCSCCPTAIGRTKQGLIAAYRDHQGEIRDISIIRQLNGRWTSPQTLHPDGWKINGCPTDGPSLITHGDRVSIAWLTRAGGEAKVQLATSINAGETFAPPQRLDSGNPLGRPAIALAPDGSAAVAWIEKTEGEHNELRLRRIQKDGTSSEPLVVSKLPPARLSGFPKIAFSGENLVVVWRDQRVRAAIVGPSHFERRSQSK